MDRDTGVALLRGLIDSLQVLNLSARKRYQLYLLWIELFEEVGFDGFEDLLDGEPADESFDRAYEETFK